MGEIAGAFARLVDELLLPVEQAVEVARQRRDFAGETAGEARFGAAMDQRQLAAQAPERRQADARLQPRAGKQHEPDQAERDRDVGDERAPQRIGRRGVERDGETENARRAVTVAVEAHLALHHVDGRVIGAAPFDRLAGRRQMHGLGRSEILVPQRARAHPHHVALGDPPIGAAAGQLIARVGEIVGQRRLVVGAERHRAGEFAPAHFELLLDQPFDVILENIGKRQAGDGERRGDRQRGERQQAQAKRSRPRIGGWSGRVQPLTR